MSINALISNNQLNENKNPTYSQNPTGHVAFFSFISELKSPQTYPKALFLLQGVDTSMYLIVATVTYRYAGSFVKSPALSSLASLLLQKIAYGIAIPTIVIAGVINGHVAAKYIYVRLFRGTDKMSQRTWRSFGLWAGIVLVLWIIAWIIAEAIPVFNDLLSLISALFASWFTYGLSGAFWLFMNRGRYRESARKMFLTGLNFVIFCIGAVIVSFPRSLSLPFLKFLFFSLSLHLKIPCSPNHQQQQQQLKILNSAVSASTSPEKPSTKTPPTATGAFPARTIRNLHHENINTYNFFLNIYIYINQFIHCEHEKTETLKRNK